MHNYLKFIIYIFLFFSLNSISTSAWSDSTHYRLSSGDIISIKVFAEPELSIEKIKLNENGNFNYPFIGQIIAKGLTAHELQQKITHKLDGDYLINPRVTVSVIEYRQFYISGEVKKPGGYPFQPGLTLRRAIALAGGLTERASERKMTIIRESDDTKEPKHVYMEDIVMPGDAINIDQGFF